MDLSVRTFEQTELTKNILDALKYAWAYGTAYGKFEMCDSIKLIIEKIEENKLDVRLIPREE